MCFPAASSPELRTTGSCQQATQEYFVREASTIFSSAAADLRHGEGWRVGSSGLRGLRQVLPTGHVLWKASLFRPRFGPTLLKPGLPSFVLCFRWGGGLVLTTSGCDTLYTLSQHPKRALYDVPGAGSGRAATAAGWSCPGRCACSRASSRTSGETPTTGSCSSPTTRR